MGHTTARPGDYVGLTYCFLCQASKNNVRPVQLVYRKHGSCFRVPGNEPELGPLKHLCAKRPSFRDRYNPESRLRSSASRLAPGQISGGIMGERHLSTIALAIALLAGAAQTLATVGGGPDWGMIGNDSTNSRNQPLEHDI